MNVQSLDFRLLNDFQRDFPLADQPYRMLANRLGVDESRVIERLRILQQQGEISRVGPVFRPNSVGASTLAAMAVPAERVEVVARRLNRFPQVNHNYEREHHWNLWFVVTDRDRANLEQTLARMEEDTGQSLLVLPLVKSYFIDLGFDLVSGSHRRKMTDDAGRQQPVALPPWADTLIAAVQHGLPLHPRPYLQLAREAGLTEDQVIDGLRQLLDAGVIKRLGVVVRHRSLGYQANAMVVWDVPDSRVDDAGRTLAKASCVNLCYQRPRVAGRWPYNLFCMIHGRSREVVRACVDELAALTALRGVAHAVLFSRRCFRQRGAVYRHG